ncbi:hypothetical protein [Rhodohalobacter sp.]|uniref:hypothetical protein n=1 Tax=Rhodohalobacter sp. TaxID=1974210 RepID=UPI002ACE4548|nr:hypothetical protein [Rhodohalobacter sp.]MDZ7755818.1 hypothetical protein [Rhodohalobacter sp.]
MKIPLIIIAAVLSVFVTQGCDKGSNDLELAEVAVIEAERDLEIAQSEIEANIGIFRQEIENKIMENNLTIADIKERIQDEDAEIKAAYEVRIEKLERTNSEMKRKMDNFRYTSRDNWDDFKDKFSSSMDDLGNSLNDFFSKTTTSLN